MPGYGGFRKLGEMLVGGDASRDEELRIKTMSALASRDQNMARAMQEIDKARMRGGLGDAYADLNSQDPAKQAQALAVIQRGGFNPQQGTAALGNLQEQRFRQGAVDAPDFTSANRQLMGVANGPVPLAAVQGDTLLGNRFVEGGMPVGPTAVGISRIDANEATARARDSAGALSTAKTAWGPTGRRGPGGVAPAKLSEVNKLRMKAELSGIDDQLKELRSRRAEMSGGDPRLEAGRGEVESQIKALEKAQTAVFDKYDQQPDGLGSRLAPAPGDEFTPMFRAEMGRDPTQSEMRDLEAGTLSVPITGKPPGKAPAAPAKAAGSKIAWTQPEAQAQLDRARKAVASGKVSKEEAAKRLRDAGLVNAAGRL